MYRDLEREREKEKSSAICSSDFVVEVVMGNLYRRSDALRSNHSRPLDFNNHQITAIHIL